MAHLGSSSTSASFTRALHLGRMGIPATEDPQWFQIFFWSVETTNKNLLWPMWLEESDPIRSIENNFPWSLWFFPSCHGFLKPWLLVFCFRGHVNSEVLFLDLSTKGSEAVRKQLETSSKLEVVKAFEDDVHWCEILGQEPECEDIWRYSCYLVKTFFVQSGFFLPRIWWCDAFCLDIDIDVLCVPVVCDMNLDLFRYEMKSDFTWT